MWFMEGEIFEMPDHSMRMMMTSNLPESGKLLVNLVKLSPPQPQIKVSGPLIFQKIFTEYENTYQMWFMDGGILHIQEHSMRMMMM